MSRLRSLLSFGNWPIFTKLIVVMILIAGIPLLVGSSVTSANTSTALRAQIGSSFQSLADSTADQVNRVLISNIDVMETAIAFAPDIQTALVKANAAYTGGDADIAAALQAKDTQWAAEADDSSWVKSLMSTDDKVNLISARLFSFQSANPAHTEVFITDKYGAEMGATGRTSNFYYAGQPWWTAAWNNGQGAIYIGEPTNAATPSLVIAVPILNPDGQILGMFHSTVSASGILDAIRFVQPGHTAYAFLVNSSGTVLIDTHSQSVGKKVSGTLAQPAVLQSRQPSWVEGVDVLGAPAIIGYAQGSSTYNTIPEIAALNWKTMVTENSSEAFATVDNIITTTIVLGVVALLFVVVIAFLLARALTTQVNHIMSLFNNIGMGDFAARVKVVSGDELGTMANSLNAMLDNTLALIQSREERDAMQNSIMKLLDEVSGVAQGDLTKNAEVTTDITGAIADAFNYMIEQLRRVISRVQDTTVQVSSSAVGVRSTAQSLAQGSESQALQIVNTSAALEEMATSIQQVSDSAATSANVAGQALNNARQGTKAVQDTIGAMNRIRDQVQETSKRIKRLGESSQEIGEIVRLIDDIADRTSILALNASIQAAMAGEAGRGFAIVAEEVERLAERSTSATRQIDALVKTIQGETNETVAAMEDSTREVVEGSQLANQAGQALSEIENVSAQLADLIQSISTTSKQQAQGAEALSRSMSEISEVTQQTAAGTKQAADSINDLSMLAEELRSSVSTFKLPAAS